MNRLILTIYRFFERQKYVLWFVLALIAVGLAFLASRIDFVEDISSFLPSKNRGRIRATQKANPTTERRGGFYIRSTKETARLRFAVRIFRPMKTVTIFPSRRFLKSKNNRIGISKNSPSVIFSNRLLINNTINYLLIDTIIVAVILREYGYAKGFYRCKRA